VRSLPSPLTLAAAIVLPTESALIETGSGPAGVTIRAMFSFCA
jgi:hypothetical protein